MDVYTARMTTVEARYVRKLGGGNFSEGVRMMIEAKIGDRRRGPDDRRRRQ